MGVADIPTSGHSQVRNTVLDENSITPTSESDQGSDLYYLISPLANRPRCDNYLLFSSYFNKPRQEIIMEEFTTFANIINGGPATGSNFTHGIDPSTKEKLWDVPAASIDDLELAISSAQTAFKSWSKTTWSHRQASLTAARDILVENKEKLAVLLTKEGGKPVSITLNNKYRH